MYEWRQETGKFSDMADEQPMESRFFHYNRNVSIHYQRRGHGSIFLLFLHGFASAYTSWRDIAVFFPPEKFSLFLIDLKGYGLSDKPRDGKYSIEEQAAIVRAFIREQSLSSVVLVGHSLGGAIALSICLDAQEQKESFQVEKLILIASAAYPQKLPKLFRKLRLPLIGPLMLRMIPTGRMVRMTLEKVFFDPATVTQGRIQMYTPYFRGKGIAYAMRATVKGIDPAAYAHISERYRHLSVPTLIIWGKEDRIIRVKNAFRLHDDIPGSKLKVLNKCGHNPHEERPAETYSAIASMFCGR